MRKVLASFPEHGVGIAATVPAADGIDIVGTAIFVLGSDPTTVPFASAVCASSAGQFSIGPNEENAGQFIEAADGGSLFCSRS